MSEYKKTTVVFPLTGDQVLLGMKGRDFGEGWWNGFGGKLSGDETYPENAVRESYEEVCIVLDESTLRHAANLIFRFGDKIEVVSRAYTTAEFTGAPQETDEMQRPTWFAIDKIPYDNMWPADTHWIPQILAKKATLPMGFVVDFTDDKKFVAIEQVDPNSIEEYF